MSEKERPARTLNDIVTDLAAALHSEIPFSREERDETRRVGHRTQEVICDLLKEFAVEIRRGAIEP
jgi:hypothetical protein